MQRIIIDVQRLFALWHDKQLTRAEVARGLGISDKTLCAMADRYGLTDRAPTYRCDSAIDVSPEDEAASADSLAFSPYVAARIKELRLGIPTC